MRAALGWTDYEIIDTSGGEKLERWKDVFLIRPDPQVIWDTEKKDPLWEKAHARYIRSSNGGGAWQVRKKTADSWKVCYKDLVFLVRPTGFKHTGLFPEQAVNWDYLRETIAKSGRQLNVLNLFGYTGAATLACASAGARVCHVDASKGIVAWARENAQASGLSDKPVRWIVDDCVRFVEREIRRGVRYDIVIMDPPSYGRGPGGEVWKLEEKIYPLLKLCTRVLSDDPALFLLNSYTTGLSPSCMAYLLSQTVGRKFKGRITADEIGLPVKASGFPLPCGCTAVFER